MPREGLAGTHRPGVSEYSSQLLPGRVHLVVGLLILVIGALVAVRPWVGLAAIGALTAIALCIWLPTFCTVVYLAFILVQDLLLNLNSSSLMSQTVLKRADEAILLLLVVTTLLARRARIPRVSYPASAALAGAMAVGVISTALYAEDYTLAAFDAFLLVKGFLVFFVVVNLPLQESAIRKVMAAILTSGVLCLGTAIADLALGDTFRTWISHPRPVEFRGGLPTAVAIFAHQGSSGWFFAFCACVAWAGWLVRRRALYLVLSACFVAGSLTSLRRKPLSGILLVFILAPLLTGRSRTALRSTITAILIIGIMSFAMGDTIVLIYGDMFHDYVFATDPMSVARNAMLLTSLQIAKDHFPVGVGFGRFGGWIAALYYSPVYYEYGLNTVYGLSEDGPSYLQDVFWPHVLGQLGFIGGALFLMALVLLLRPLIRSPISESDSARMIRFAAVFCFVEAIPESLGWMVFENSLAAAWIFGLIALATRCSPAGGFGLGHGATESHQPPRIVSRTH